MTQKTSESDQIGAEASAVRPSSAGSGAALFVERYYLQLGVLLLLVILALAVPRFATGANAANIMTQASFAGLIACGMTLLIAGGLFDLSVAGIVALAAVIAGTLLPHTTIGLAAGAGLAVGVGLGILNGIVVTKIRIPPFIATFGMYNIYLAAAFILTDGNVLPIVSTHYRAMGTASFGGIPGIFLVFSGVCVLSHLLLYRTRFGRQLRAVGSSEPAARMGGIPVDRIKIVAFALTGLFTALAAVGLSALLSSANGTMATGIELTAITIAVVGGTALRGGQGTLVGTFTGAIFITSVSNALNLLGVQSYWQTIGVGAILVLTLVVGSLTSRTRIRGAE
ncbi:MAG: ABC transporter permease [Propioniciclava sp.]